jgi:hypothetical protein
MSSNTPDPLVSVPSSVTGADHAHNHSLAEPGNLHLGFDLRAVIVKTGAMFFGTDKMPAPVLSPGEI